MFFGKLKRQLNNSYGKRPDFYYFDGDIRCIRTYYDYRHDCLLDEFLIDDTTWNDLSMDDIFKRINQGISTSGEQYLYYLLRSPAIEQNEYNKRLALIEMMENNPDIRLKLQIILSRLGRRRAANTNESFRPSAHSPIKLVLYLMMVLVLAGCIAGMVFVPSIRLVCVLFIVFVPLFHQFSASRMESDLATVNYSVSMVIAQKRIKHLSFPELDKQLPSFYEAGSRLKSVTRIGSVCISNTNDAIMTMVNSFLFLDLITYELLKNRLGKHYDDIFHIHEYLGRIDAAIAIASYRKSLNAFTIPHIDFSNTESARLCAVDVVHPLIDKAVPNSIDTDKPVLLTGSNASGKSTFLKTVVVNAILAQSICTVLGLSYKATPFRIYTSMAIADNLLAGESYFISEIKSLKRIVDAITAQKPLLCVIDEVLRGTNTVERIAASSEVLKHIVSEKVLCFAATHDIELCDLLGGQYRLLHFEESVTDNGEVMFDYKLKDEAAITRNAIKLLKGIGFDSEIINNANERVDLFVSSGKWKT